MKLAFAEVQRNLSEIANRESYSDDVLYELLAAYGRSASSITKLRNGVINKAANTDNEILQRGVVYYRRIDDSTSLPAEIEKLEKDPLTARFNPRYLIVTDNTYFAAKDTKKGSTLEIKWQDIDRNIDFFYGWTGNEVTDEKTEAVADRRAAEKMKDLYYEVEKINRDKLTVKGNTFRRDLNVFFSRLLFCFFAEDTGVFSREEDGMVTNSIRDYTQVDGSDLDDFLETLFSALDEEDNSSYTSPFSNFPYVNGNLFDAKRGIEMPKFNAQARKLILECGALSWAEINPDIFGSMFQGIIEETDRATHGIHYTSVPNIMKTIEPLFLDELREEFDKSYDNPNKLAKLHNRIANIKIFDPACGSGNFLIIAYKELRKLEHAILERILENKLQTRVVSRIDLNNFYGIEIDEFACEIAVLSLYLAKHQMNIEFEKQFGKEIKLIPLQGKANIKHGNAARIDWQEVCTNKPRMVDLVAENQEQLITTDKNGKNSTLVTKEWDEIYLISNPPYGGARKQDLSQKSDLDFVFKGVTDKYRNMDYVAIWFYKAAEWLNDSSKAAISLVSTNSISQGQQINLVWPLVMSTGSNIDYAFTSFKWQNSAKDNAGITCVIIALSKRKKVNRYIFTENIRSQVEHITPYLQEKTHGMTVGSRSKPLSVLPKMEFGNMPLDGGNLILSDKEKNDLLEKRPKAKELVLRLYGAKEYINDIKRWCIWVRDDQIKFADSIPELKERIEAVKSFRLSSKDKGTQKKAVRPHSFREQKMPKSRSLIVPSVSSERREYVPIGYTGKKEVISNAAQAIYDPEPWLFSLLSSKIHMAWLRAVGGRLKTDLRYSKDIVYNNFPVPSLAEHQKDALNQSAREILFARENHTEKTLAEMYDPDKMPEDLREAHHKNDILVDRLYRLKPYENDEERLADLFALYEEMTANEKE